VSRKLAWDKGKRKIFKNPEAEKSYNFREDPPVEKVYLEIEVKRQQREMRGEQRKREKQRLEDAKRKL